MPLQLANVDMGLIVRSAAESFGEEARSAGIDLRVLADGHRLVVAGDEGRLTQVIYNLTTNALKFTPEGGTVTLRAVGDDDGVTVAVQDTGQGIDPDALTGLFQPFVQLHDDPDRKGSGLGLYVSRGIVEAHGGSIDGNSEGKGRGATFTVHLPVGPASMTPTRGV